MLKCHSELFKSSVKLADGLRLSTKEELKDVAQLLLLPIPSKLRKKSSIRISGITKSDKKHSCSTPACKCFRKTVK